MSVRGLGYREDKPDTRDQAFAVSMLLSGSSPAGWSLQHHAPQQLDQDGMNACVGFSTSIALYTKQKVDGISQPVLPSAGFIWYNSRKTHGDEQLNEGTYIREAFKTLKTLGAAPEADWSNKELPFRFAERPAHMAYTHGYDWRFGVNYKRLDQIGSALAEQVRACIYGGCPVVFGISVPFEFTSGSFKTHHAYTPEPGAAIAGGHAMCILGYDAAGVYGPNSWGSDWGNNGWFHLSWDYFIDDSRDRWTVLAAPRIE